jgi:hypothetical protein
MQKGLKLLASFGTDEGMQLVNHKKTEVLKYS